MTTPETPGKAEARKRVLDALASEQPTPNLSDVIYDACDWGADGFLVDHGYTADDLAEYLFPLLAEADRSDVSISPPFSHLDPSDEFYDPADIHWTVSGNFLYHGWFNYDMEAAVMELLHPSKQFSYDTESDCFFAYTLNEADAEKMVKAIEYVIERPLKVSR